MNMVMFHPALKKVETCESDSIDWESSHNGRSESSEKVGGTMLPIL